MNSKDQEKISLHGGDIYTEGVFKGRKLIDFSSNINPLGISEIFKNNLEEGLKNAEIYPDVHYRELKDNIIKYLGVNFIKENDIVLGNGAAEIIDLSIGSFKKVLIVVPSFVEYELDARKWGCEIEFSSLNENMDIDYEDVFSKFHGADALIIGNPNNPNGKVINKNKFWRILQYAESSKKTIILDEAFIEFTEEKNNTFLKEIGSYSCIFIIRALTKFFAIPGIRFGYGITKKQSLINRIKEKQNPWNINCFAELAAKYILKDKKYIKESKAWMNEEVNYLPKAFKKIKFIDKVFPTNCNFVLCKLKNITDEKLYNLCLQEGIVIRKASNFITLDNRYVRFAIKNRENNQKLLNVLKSIEEKI